MSKKNGFLQHCVGAVRMIFIVCFYVYVRIYLFIQVVF